MSGTLTLDNGDTISVIPLQPYAQSFSITLVGVVYSMRTYWNSAPNGGWCLDINDVNNNPILLGIPMVTGVDLLEQQKGLGIGGQLWVATNGNALAPPTYTNLGADCNLYFITNPPA